MRYWKTKPEIKQDRLTSNPRQVMFTATGRRSDGVACYVQETHEFHVEQATPGAIYKDAKLIGEKLRARLETYLDPMCMCCAKPVAPCPVNHERAED